jgi:hypothetical protein
VSRRTWSTRRRSPFQKAKVTAVEVPRAERQEQVVCTAITATKVVDVEAEDGRCEACWRPMNRRWARVARLDGTQG